MDLVTVDLHLVPHLEQDQDLVDLVTVDHHMDQAQDLVDLVTVDHHLASHLDQDQDLVDLVDLAIVIHHLALLRKQASNQDQDLKK